MGITKEQERQALGKIQKIINDLGEGSYLSITFDGIIEQAEENIANDWGICPVKDLETARERIASMQRIENENNKTIAQLNDACRERLEEKTDLEEMLKTERKVDLENIGKLNQALGQLNAKQNEIESLEAEIITLKAKLYDLMTA